MVPGEKVFKGVRQGGFCIFFRAVLEGKRDKIGKVFLQKLGSDLVVQSSRECYPAQNFALYHLGMVPGDKVLKVRCWSSELSTRAK